MRVITRLDQSCQFDWFPPSESVGGIGGYKIRYGKKCGHCNPAAGFVNKTELTADCMACIEENNNMCCFEVNTVSKDCSFDSLPVEATTGEFYMNFKTAFTCVYVIYRFSNKFTNGQYSVHHLLTHP